jgi:hypothetical protein
MIGTLLRRSGKESKARAACALAMPAILALSSILSGCVAPVEDGEDLGGIGEPIENGELRPAALNGGTVRLQVRNAANTGWSYCSGQVISRDSILTAAHCFYDGGWFDDGWDNRISVAIQATHQNANGSWENVTQNGGTNEITATVLVQEAYVDYREAGDTLARGYDVAVVRAPNVLSNITSSDVAAIARLTSQRPEWTFAYGHGYYTDFDFDAQLRRGYLEDLTWYPTSGTSNYRTIVSDYGDADSHICSGDSGGPWKMQTDTATLSGVQFGVTTSGLGAGECREDFARAAMVAFHDTWLEARVEAGRGSCVIEDHAVLPHLDDWEIVNISTLVCW